MAPLSSCVHFVLSCCHCNADTMASKNFVAWVSQINKLPKGGRMRQACPSAARRTSPQDNVVPFTVIEGPAAWRSADLRQRPEEWLYYLTPQVSPECMHEAHCGSAACPDDVNRFAESQSTSRYVFFDTACDADNLQDVEELDAAVQRAEASGIDEVEKVINRFSADTCTVRMLVNAPVQMWQSVPRDCDQSENSRRCAITAMRRCRP